MRTPLLLFVLASATAARAERGYVIDREQSLTSVEVRGLSAVSRALAGRFKELEGGAFQVEARVPLASFVGERRLPPESSGAQEIVFEGVSERPRDGKLRIKGTLTLHGTTRPLELVLAMARAGGVTFAHAYFAVRLREFGISLPAGMSDEARVQIDAALRPDSALARG